MASGTFGYLGTREALWNYMWNYVSAEPLSLKVTPGHHDGHLLLDHLDFLSWTRNVGYTYFQTKTVEMTLKVDQGHW